MKAVSVNVQKGHQALLPSHYKPNTHLDAGQLGNVLVESDAVLFSTGLGDGDRDTEDGVGTNLGLVRRAVELDEEVVERLLVCDLDAGLLQLRPDDIVDIGNSLGDACWGRKGKTWQT